MLLPHIPHHLANQASITLAMSSSLFFTANAEGGNTRHLAAATNINHRLLPFAFETFGAPEPVFNQFKKVLQKDITIINHEAL